MQHNYSHSGWRIHLALIGLILSICGIQAQEAPQNLQAYRIEVAPKIDGKLTDDCWQSGVESWEGSFTQSRPNNGQKASQITKIQLAYDDEALYVGAMLYDNAPDSILTELSLRDEGGKNVDEFLIGLDPYYQRQNAFFFRVSAAGVQSDYFVTPNDRDFNWNAVWQSAVRIHDCGWTVEFAIPYSAIRFPKQDIQTWGINFARQIQRHQEDSWWHPVDPNINGTVNQFGTLLGIRDVKPPLRLQFTPYLTGYVAQSEAGAALRPSLTGGMDVKLGLNESFTLDVSLVPDFGQVRSDNIVLNLSPFEVRFDENRPFFTEGTELFQRGTLFYSRRVGRSFGVFGEVKAHEVITAAPSDAPLLNAVKLSGRTKKGLGIGFFNAVTNSTFALAEDTLKGETRELIADPVTNFNMVVLDQNLKNNSNIALANTNVTRFGDARDANVTSLEFSFFDKRNTYNVRGEVALSQIFEKVVGNVTVRDVGHRYFLQAGKVSGRVQFNLSRLQVSHNYNSNDMGFLRSPNEVTHSGEFSYEVNEPTGIFNRYRISAEAYHRLLHKPQAYDNWGGEIGASASFRNFWWARVEFGGSPSVTDDHFESRYNYRVFKKPASLRGSVRLWTDRRKRLRLGGNMGIWHRPEWGSLDNWIGFNPRYRFSDKFTLEHDMNLTWRRNEYGFATHLFDDNGDVEEIMMGSRDLFIATNTLSGSYIFNDMMGINLRVRHYWSRVEYNDYYSLDQAGYIQESDYKGLDKDGQSLHNRNFNAFNVDLVYNWQFAPGSMMSLVWKNSIYTNDNLPIPSFGQNFNNTLRSPMVNSFSIRILYFLDYLQIKKLFS